MCIFSGVVLFLSHCASTPVRGAYNVAVQSMSVTQPQTDVERKVINKLDQIAANSPKQIDGCLVVVEQPYFAASGRLCRRIHFTYQGRSPSTEVRLACQNGSSRGVYVPDVFPRSASPKTKASSNP